AASSSASSFPGESTWTQVRPLALSSLSLGCGSATTSPGLRTRVRRMRGRLGTGTERVVGSHGVVILPRRRLSYARGQKRVGLGLGDQRAAANLARKPSLEGERPARDHETDRCGERPQRERLLLEDEAADRRPDDKGQLPRRGGECHVAAEQPRRGELRD